MENTNPYKRHPKIKTAVILAAGLGSRLGKRTEHLPKCLIEVNGVPMLYNAINALVKNNIEKIVIVAGHQAQEIEAFVQMHDFACRIHVLYNHHYASTNNIYSLWVAYNMIRLDEGFLLLEADLVFNPDILWEFMNETTIALDIYDPAIHSGTTASVDDNGYLKSLYFRPEKPATGTVWKTVNIYSFRDNYVKRLFYMLDSYISRGETQVYYEYAIQEIQKSYGLQMKMIDFSEVYWNEIDTEEDLNRVMKCEQAKRFIKEPA